MKLKKLIKTGMILMNGKLKLLLGIVIEILLNAAP